MRHLPKLVLAFALVLPVLLVAGCGRDEGPTAPATATSPDAATGVDPALVAGEIVLASEWPFAPDAELPAQLAWLRDKAARHRLLDFQREVIAGDVVHYSIVVSVGPSEYDVIGIHRVVRERRPWRPIKSREALFLVHGAGKDFVGNFLPGVKSPLIPDDVGFAFFLATRDVDVWGIDCSYTLTPPGLGDYDFAAGWNLEKHIDDVATGIEVARLTRLFTGNGLRKMILLGYSQGTLMGYGLLGRETALPPGRRTVAAYISVDENLGWNDPEAQELDCENVAWYEDLFDDGIYLFEDDPDGFYNSIGVLARDYPYDPSPHYDGFTNLEVFLYFTAVAEPPLTQHYWAATFAEDGWPLDFAYTTLLTAAEFWIHWAPMAPPSPLWVDQIAILCGEEDTVWEQDLGAIELPVLSLEAGGGFGPLMDGALDRLVSADVTRHVVQLQANPLLDFGHVDLFTAENAAALAWQPTLDWIAEVVPGQGRQVPDFAAVLSPEAREELLSLQPTPPSGGWARGSVVHEADHDAFAPTRPARRYSGIPVARHR